MKGTGCEGKAGGWHKICLRRGRPPMKDFTVKERAFAPIEWAFSPDCEVNRSPDPADDLIQPNK